MIILKLKLYLKRECIFFENKNFCLHGLFGYINY